MRLIDRLRDLQTTDLALDQRRERLAHVRERLRDRSELEAAAARRDEAERAYRRAEADQLDLELDVARRRSKVEELNKRLYSGKGSPRELQNLAADVEQEQRLISEREDRLLAAYDATALSERERALARQAYEEIEARWRAEHEALEREAAQLEAEISRLEAERESRRAAIEPQPLRLYDSLRRSRGGLAVVPIQQRTCQGCRIALPVSEEVRARAGRDLVTCQSCGRILYAL